MGKASDYALRIVREWEGGTKQSLVECMGAVIAQAIEEAGAAEREHVRLLLDDAHIAADEARNYSCANMLLGLIQKLRIAGETEVESDLYRECPGHGRCHGAMRWCSACGNVAAVCDAVGCDVHREVRP